MPAGATPIMVPARPGFPGGIPIGPPIPGGGGAGGPPGPGPMGACWLISIVPLNFGADAPLRLNPHLTHVDAVSEFCVPQFGQNTPHLRWRPEHEPRPQSARSVDEASQGAQGVSGQRFWAVFSGRANAPSPSSARDGRASAALQRERSLRRGARRRSRRPRDALDSEARRSLACARFFDWSDAHDGGRRFCTSGSRIDFSSTSPMQHPSYDSRRRDRHESARG